PPLTYYTPLSISYCHPAAPPDLHSFPTRRSSDLSARAPTRCASRPPSAPRRSTCRPAGGRSWPGGSPPERPWNCSSGDRLGLEEDRKSTRLNSSHLGISYAVFCLKKKTQQTVMET